MSKIIVYLFLTLVLCLACNRTEEQEENDRLYVVATTGMIADLVLNVGGDIVRIDALMGPGVDPHLFKATASDARKLLKAQVIFYNGLHLEGKMESIFKKLKKQKSVYAIADAIPKNLLRSVGEEIYDPHIWFDVSLWEKAAEEIARCLSLADKKNASFYGERSKVYREKLQKLHEWARLQIGSIEKEKRLLITAHDAFGYFSQAYDIEVMGLQGISTQAEYGIKDVERIVDILVKRKIHAIFVESSIPSRILESVVYGCKKQNHDLKMGGSLFSDAMGESGTTEGTYLGMVEHNVRTIVQELSPLKNERKYGKSE